MTPSGLRDARVVFLGTPAFAIPSLNALRAAGATLVGVVTQPDKPSGRGRQIFPPPAKTRAAELGLPIFQPKGLKKEENRAFLKQLRPDILVVVAYGKILPKEVLDLPRFGAVNVHASLLPRYRGPAPISAAILAGDAETGVTIMKLDERVDQGPVLAQERVPIAADDTTAALSAKLAEAGARLLVPTLERYVRSEVTPVPQDDSVATVCALLTKDDGRIDWTKPAARIARMVRAYNPWPRAYTAWQGKPFFVHRAVPAAETTETRDAQPGTVLRDTVGITVRTGDGYLLLQDVQLAGGKSLPVEVFLRGHPTFLGSRLGDAR